MRCEGKNLMTYQRKTRDVWRFYVNYGYGWEHELDEYSLSEIKKRKKEYRENCPQYPIKVVKGRERIVNDYDKYSGIRTKV
jgi:hypothetical protein